MKIKHEMNVQVLMRVISNDRYGDATAAVD